MSQFILRNVLYLELPITQTLFSFQTRFGLVVHTSYISISAKLSVIKGFVVNLEIALSIQTELIFSSSLVYVIITTLLYHVQL